MEKRNLIENEAEKTLQSLDGIGKAEVNPYLYNKILNGINEPAGQEKKFNFRLALAVMIICILTNLATMLSVQSSSSTTAGTTVTVSPADSVRSAQIKSLASEFISTNNFYFY